MFFNVGLAINNNIFFVIQNVLKSFCKVGLYADLTTNNLVRVSNFLLLYKNDNNA
jgi:hypothetical protein